MHIPNSGGGAILFSSLCVSPHRGNSIKNWGYLLSSERSERDTIRGGQLKIEYMFDVYIYIYILSISTDLG